MRNAFNERRELISLLLGAQNLLVNPGSNRSPRSAFKKIAHSYPERVLLSYPANNSLEQVKIALRRTEMKIADERYQEPRGIIKRNSNQTIAASASTNLDTTPLSRVNPNTLAHWK
jgi:hypothetical protein